MQQGQFLFHTATLQGSLPESIGSKPIPFDLALLPSLAEPARQAETRYERVFLCNADIPYDDTWCRSGEANRDDMHRWTFEELYSRNAPYSILPPNHEDRMSQLADCIARQKAV